MKDTSDPPLLQETLLRRLRPILVCMTVFFCITGAGLATVPLFVALDLGMGPTAIGVIAGAQFVTTVALRLAAGRYSDRHGPKQAMTRGLQMAVLAGVFSLGAWALTGTPLVSAVVLVGGRILLGGAESFVMTSGQTWGLAISGPVRAAQVIGWVGTSMFAAMAIGAPIGGAVYGALGFAAVALFMALTPVALLVLVAGIPAAMAVSAGNALRFWAVFRRVFPFGLCQGFVAFSYGAMVTFSVILFIEKGWVPTWAALTVFSLALIVARMAIGSLPDRMSGVKAPVLSLVLLAAGLVVMGLGGHWAWGYAGAFVAGFGYALVYPSLGREVLRRVPEENRGTALSIFASFVFVTLGFGSPLLGMIAESFGTDAVFVFSGAMAVVAMALVVVFHRFLPA